MATFLKESSFSNSSNFKLILEYEKVMNQEENYHDVTYYLYFQTINGYSGGGSATLGYINNLQVGSTTSISKNSKLLLGTKTERIYHNDTNLDGTKNDINPDGTKSINYSASIYCPWNTVGTASVSGTLILPKINRASTWDFSVNELQMSNIEDTLILKFNKYNSNYKNKITISNLQNTEIVKTIDNVENNYSLTFSNEELEQLYTLDTNTEKTNLRFYLNLYTYDSLENQIGEVQRTMMNAYLLDANPTFTYVIEETDDKVINLLNSNSADTIIKSASKPKITVNPVALKGASISTVSIVNGTQANANENPYIFENVQTGTFTIIVTDSRGLTKTQVITRNLINYTEIYINDFSFKRASQTSSNIILNADITCFKGSFNSIQNTPQLFYKIGANNEYIEITNGFTFENNKVKFVDYDMGAILPYNEANTIYLYVLDLLTEDMENYLISKGIAAFEAGEHDFQVNGDLFLANTNRENKINILEKINSLEPKSYKYTLNTKSNATSGSWEELADDFITGNIPAGKYIILFSSAFISSGAGVATLNPYLDGSRESISTRNSIPLAANNLTMSGQAIMITEFETEQEHSINLYVYSNVNINSINHVTIEFLKI